EPALLLELMGRHRDWCACICLIGGGQEINTGEQGLSGWGDALRNLPHEAAAQWHVYGPPDVFHGGQSTAGDKLGAVQPVQTHEDSALQLLVPMRSFRSQRVSEWVAHVLEGNAPQAHAVAQQLGRYPIVLTRSLEQTRDWLGRRGRGKRTYGLVASSG